MKKKYLVYCWLNGVDFDTNKSANYRTVVTTTSEDKAEDAADKRFLKKFGHKPEAIEVQSVRDIDPASRPISTHPGLIRTVQA